jgi:hypothetical protein
MDILLPYNVWKYKNIRSTLENIKTSEDNAMTVTDTFRHSEWLRAGRQGGLSSNLGTVKIVSTLRRADRF